MTGDGQIPAVVSSQTSDNLKHATPGKKLLRVKATSGNQPSKTHAGQEDSQEKDEAKSSDEGHPTESQHADSSSRAKRLKLEQNVTIAHPDSTYLAETPQKTPNLKSSKPSESSYEDDRAKNSTPINADTKRPTRIKAKTLLTETVDNELPDKEGNEQTEKMTETKDPKTGANTDEQEIETPSSSKKRRAYVKSQTPETPRRSVVKKTKIVKDSDSESLSDADDEDIDQTPNRQSGDKKEPVKRGGPRFKSIWDFYSSTLRLASKKDRHEIFRYPVTEEEAPMYFSIITSPMDFETMKKKVEKKEYASFEMFKNDLFLVFNNAMEYNPNDTIYYRQAKKLKKFMADHLDGMNQRLDIASLQAPTPTKPEKTPSKKDLQENATMAQDPLPSERQHTRQTTEGLQVKPQPSPMNRPPQPPRLVTNSQGLSAYQPDKGVVSSPTPSHYVASNPNRPTAQNVTTSHYSDPRKMQPQQIVSQHHHGFSAGVTGPTTPLHPLAKGPQSGPDSQSQVQSSLFSNKSALVGPNRLDGQGSQFARTLQAMSSLTSYPQTQAQLQELQSQTSRQADLIFRSGNEELLKEKGPAERAAILASLKQLQQASSQTGVSPEQNFLMQLHSLENEGFDMSFLSRVFPWFKPSSISKPESALAMRKNTVSEILAFANEAPMNDSNQATSEKVDAILAHNAQLIFNLQALQVERSGTTPTQIEKTLAATITKSLECLAALTAPEALVRRMDARNIVHAKYQPRLNTINITPGTERKEFPQA
eukprot:TRINITY_DN6530_c0_g1_i1.p1 TRINITY_DN6530_c0_g1~~TRINITY_DN6530_c0_g1_i1.p1  ORF type:complete len:764 (+),score=157.48 TRINITY_DN6530_c0_g1_i1:386-2677(+)